MIERMHELSHSLPNLKALATNRTMIRVLNQVRIRFRTTSAVKTLLKAIVESVAVHFVT
jgi:hypothetical protein